MKSNIFNVRSFTDKHASTKGGLRGFVDPYLVTSNTQDKFELQKGMEEFVVCAGLILMVVGSIL